MSNDNSNNGGGHFMSEAWVDFVAGWCSGAMAVITCQPVDTALTRLQAGGTVGGVPRNMMVATASPTSIVSLQTQQLISQHGIKALWRGSSAMITAVPMQNSLLMGGYGLGKKWAAANDNERNDKTNIDSSSAPTSATSTTLMSVFVGGCTGGIVQSFLMSPVELMKVNQQVIGSSARDAGRQLLHGLLSFTTTKSSLSSTTTASSWRGLNATLLRDGIPHGVWFVAYEWCKTELGQRLKSDTSEGGNSTTNNSIDYHQQMTVPLVSGAYAATVAWAVGYPFDIIKTRIQSTNTSMGIYETGVQLVKEANGNVAKGLYRGFGLKLVRAVPASMVGFTTYEFVASQFQ